MKKILSTLTLLVFAVLLMGQWHIDEDFEGISSLPTGWTYADQDGDGSAWRIVEHSFAYSGTQAVFVDNFLPNQNEDWLMTPQISVNQGDVLKFYSRSWFSTESLQVYVSTTGNQVNNFNTLLLDIQDMDTIYNLYTVSLDAYAGVDIYLGFLWECENYAVIVDDVKIGQDQQIDPELNLPDTISFYASQIYEMDFSDYIVVTDPANASLSAADNANITVMIDGFMVSFSTDGYVGSEDILFTLTDDLSGLTADASLTVNVLADPAADLFVADILSPRDIEFLNLPLIPEIVVGNAGTASFNSDIEISLQVFDEANALVHSDQLISTVDLPSGGTAPLSFGSSFSPATQEDMRFVFEITTEDDNPANNTLETTSTILLRITSGGPDDFGYRFFDSNDPLGPEYDWIDISQTGESTIMYNVPSWGGDDNFSEPIPLGFDFPFYGSSYSTAHVDINGEILLAQNSWYNEYPSNGWASDGNMFNYMHPIPGYSQMPALIAVYWDDLCADQGTGDILFESFGTAPERYTIIQWDELRFYAGTGGDSLLKFQVILHENGDIKMQYHTVATGQSGSSVPHDHGKSSTIAIQNEATNAGLTYLREIVQGSSYLGVEPPGNILHDELAILFYSGEDTQPPIITHDEIGNTFDTFVDLEAEIYDMSTPIDASLFYDIGSGWQESSPSSVDEASYHFTLDNLPLGGTVNYYFRAEDSEGNLSLLPENAPVEYYSFRILPTADAQVLLAFSGNQDYNRVELTAYQEALDLLGIDYDIWDWQEHEIYAIPAQYQGVLAYANTGSANDQMQFFASTLCDYLDLGTDADPKYLWFSSDGLAFNQHAHPNSSNIRRLMSGYFRTSYVPTGFGGGTNGLGGPDNFSYEHGTILALPGTPVGTEGVEYAVYANSPDCIFPNDAAGSPYYDDVPYPEIPANYIYAFEDGPINGQAYLYHGVAATTVETPSYSTMYFSFDFSQLTQEIDRLAWMQDLMDWWQIEEVSNDDSIAPTAQSRLEKIYPNPFNPSTTIRYSLKAQDKVDLVIYNLKGQKVKSLVSEVKSAGSHNIIWNGTDDNGRPVSSGIYYLRMNTSDSTQTRKLTMIK